MLSCEDEKKVKYAMRIIFHLLHKGGSALGIDELYLPSQGKLLVKSSEMVCNVSPRFAEVIKKLRRPILVRFEECGLKKAADGYIDALPESLTPLKFDEILREEVAPDCKRSICPEAHDGSVCKFQEQFQNLLKSDEFQAGIKRLLMHDRKNPQEYEKKIKKLRADVRTKCAGFETIKIHIIHRDSNEVLDSLEDICYAVQEKDAWTLYMQHEFKDDRRLLSAASCVNKILGDCIKKEMGIIAMLSCSLPCEISSELDKLDITYSSSKGADNFDDSDEEILSDLEIDCEDGDGNYDSKRGNRRRGKGGGGRHSGKGDDYQEEDDNFFLRATRKRRVGYDNPKMIWTARSGCCNQVHLLVPMPVFIVIRWWRNVLKRCYLTAVECQEDYLHLTRSGI
ncbi:uncharacterized protein LOC114523910 [Dendronephthya gigantea]|uniref:uncharacterized protein LOC114523910 n=1 Tax=Dendronephthya gigantea TaxID=151771 RepID=UPI00106B787E|nr:uncharacterized protein LOC114523910 [Dendronephthya gigantea]